MAWVRVAAESELADGAGIECLAGERLVALFRVGGEIFALDGVCPHQGGPLGQGTLDGTCVACPWHGWQFDLRTGRQQFSPTLRQPTFPVRVESGEIFVQLEEA